MRRPSAPAYAWLLSGILAISLTITLQAAEPDRNLSADDLISKVRSDMATFELPLYGGGADSPENGFPICADILNRRLEENFAIIRKRLGHPLLIARFDEMSHHLPNKAFREAQKPLSDPPLHPTTHWLDEKSESSPSWCFRGQTPIVRLTYQYDQRDKRRPSKITAPARRIYPQKVERYGIEIAQLKYINRGQYVLSTTAAMFPNDPHMQFDCWTVVTNILQGNMHHKEQNRYVTWKTEAGESITVESAPGHRFYASTGDGEWNWIKAEELTHDSQLFAKCGKETCTVSDLQPRVYDYALLRRLFSDYIAVYNLATDVYTYYIGDMDTRVLVHNAK